MGHEIIYRIDMSEEDAWMERNKLLKMDDMANFIWEIQQNLIFNRHDAMETAADVIVRLVELLDEHGLNSEDLVR